LKEQVSSKKSVLNSKNSRIKSKISNTILRHKRAQLVLLLMMTRETQWQNNWLISNFNSEISRNKSLKRIPNTRKEKRDTTKKLLLKSKPTKPRLRRRERTLNSTRMLIKSLRHSQS
jgi:hypothetical protein